jgi:hydroxymethylbilane synthase
MSTQGLVVRIGTRGSALARTQAESVARALRMAHPGLRVELREISTEGDRTQHSNQPSGDWGRGVFVKEIEAALLRGDVDLAVHSLKDVPPDVPAGLALVAIPEREDPRDVLVTKEALSLDQMPAGARIGTSSARRAAFLRAVRPDLAFVPIRGNVDTRCRKLLAGQYDGIVLAGAGLVRLGLEVPHTLLDPSVLPPAPGQGALALEARADDVDVRDLVQPLNQPAIAAAITAERCLMAELESGCRAPVAALASPREDGTLELVAAVAAPNGSRVIWATAVGSLGAPEELGLQAAAQLRAGGVDELLAEHRETAPV